MIIADKAEAQAEPRPDYPTFLPPMLVKELRQNIRTKGFIALFVGLQLIMVLMLLLTLMSGETDASVHYGLVNGFFWSLLGVVLLLLTPARANNALNLEIENKTIDLLLLTRLSAWRIVVGKWGSLMGTGLLLTATLLPYGVLRYFFGSVNLFTDLATIAGMIILSAVFTAMLLWASGQAKVVRIIIPIGIVLLLQSAGMSFFTSRMVAGAGAGTRSPLFFFANTGGLQLALAAVCLLFLLVLFLLLAARRLAPPAESNAVALRCLPVLGIAIASALMAMGHAQGPILIAFVFFMAVCAIEFSHAREPMAVHWRPWLGRGVYGRLLGRLCLPGWSSTALFAAFGLGLFALIGMNSSMQAHRGSGLSYTWWLILGWQMLLFPATLIAVLPRAAGKWLGGMGYFLIQGVMAILAVFAANLSVVNYPNLSISLITMGNILPCSSFWLTGVNLTKQGISIQFFIGQAIMMAGILLLAWTQSQPTRSMLRTITLREGPEPEPLKLERRR